MRPQSPPPLPPVSGGPNQDSESDHMYRSQLIESEPLYQFYQDRESLGLGLGEGGLLGEIEADPIYQASRQQALSGSSSLTGGPLVPSLTGHTHRTLWAELPQVQESGILSSMDSSGRRLQEAIFEILSSEASYLKSLNVLVFHFANSEQFSLHSSILSETHKELIFANVIQVRQSSELFLADLEKRWQESRSILMPSISDIILSHTRSQFNVYVTYCAAQPAIHRSLKQLRRENLFFAEALKQLESNEKCEGLSLYSFLMLPMQRITRLPLLTSALLSHLPPSSPEAKGVKDALEALTSLAGECNEAARKEERLEELERLQRSIDWREIPPLDLLTNERWIIRSQPVNRLNWRENPEKLTFGRRANKQGLQLILLTDMLLICKKKSDSRLAVVDYCPRNLVQMSVVDAESLPVLLGSDSPLSLWLTMLQNSDNRTQEMLLIFPSASERRWWLEAPYHSEEQIPENGTLHYQVWDCPRAQALVGREGDGPGELTLQEGDTANILARRHDGWLLLQKKEGGKGWVPGSSVQEIESSHRRAKNFRQRHHFLQSLAQSGTV